jgi:hypothetical protein
MLSRSQHLATEQQQEEMIHLVAPNLKVVQTEPTSHSGASVFHNERAGAEWYAVYSFLDPEQHD